MIVLQYADAFESYLVQMEDYDELSYLTKFIFGLRPAILSEVFVQRLATLLEAKRTTEELDLTQTMLEMDQTYEKEKTIKTAQHGGTQERRSARLHQSFQLRTHQMKTCSVRDRYQRRKTDSGNFGYISTQKRSKGCELSRDSWAGDCVEIYAERSALRDRVGHVRRQGSVVTIDLVALTQKKERKTLCRRHCGWKIHAFTWLKAKTHTSLPSQQINAKRQREEDS